MHPEDVDAALGGARDEPAHEVALERARADEEPAAKGHSERRRAASVKRANPFPGAFDASLDEPVEAAAAGYLETAEPRLVERAGELEQLRAPDVPGQRLLAQEPDRGVPQLGHAEPAVRPARCSGARAGRP